MTLFPITEILGHSGLFIIVFIIGIGFGASLELSGFGDSRKLAAQFYFKDLTVLKVMFTAIIVAMTLILFTSSVGLLDYDLVWVNPTYLWPGIVGGLIMGVGFVIGGFCPGTSLVAMVSLKLDGLFFVIGVLFGIFVFGETIDSSFPVFWNSSYMGRLTIQDWLGVDAGVVGILILLIAIALFIGSEKIEQVAGGKAGFLTRNRKFNFTAAGALAVIALVTLVIGQPTSERKWSWMPKETKKLLADRKVYIQPIEMLSVMKGRSADPILLDIRSEAEFNRFHIVDSQNVTFSEALNPSRLRKLKANIDAVVFIVAEKEDQAAELWKMLKAEKVPNVYILEKGINNWIDFFSQHAIRKKEAGQSAQKAFYSPMIAVGGANPVADPEIHEFRNIKFEPKVKLSRVKAGAGGCG